MPQRFDCCLWFRSGGCQEAASATDSCAKGYHQLQLDEKDFTEMLLSAGLVFLEWLHASRRTEQGTV